MMSSSSDAAVALELQESGWEELRREARKLEGDLDVKLSSYARLAARSSSAAAASGAASPTADRSSWKSMEFEIQSLLGKLQDVNDAMSRCAASCATTTSVSQKLARHRDILHEFTQVPSLQSAPGTLVWLNRWLIASSGGSFVRGSRSSGGRGGTSAP
jgi:Golgi SNAP receptor complex protein 1